MNNFLGKILFLLLLSTAIAGQIVAQTRSKTAVKKTAAPATTGATAMKEPWKQLNTKERLAEITTDYGVMIVKLYDSTPLHRDNFIKLTTAGFYDSLLFHRVISQFMIQGGDPLSKNAASGVPLGSGSAAGDRIPAEFKPCLFHKKGVIAAARDNNPERASSNCQFYIVQGKPMPEPELDKALNERIKPVNPEFNYTQTQKEIYSRIGGTPFLDQNYTVFGEVISGLDIIDKIAKAPKDASDRPVENISMKIRMLN